MLELTPEVLARPLRIEYSGVLYHLTSRGDRREAIFEDDEKNRSIFLHALAEVVGRFHWLCHAYCLMSNHSPVTCSRAASNGLSEGGYHNTKTAPAARSRRTAWRCFKKTNGTHYARIDG